MSYITPLYKHFCSISRHCDSSLDHFLDVKYFLLSQFNHETLEAVLHFLSFWLAFTS